MVLSIALCRCCFATIFSQILAKILKSFAFAPRNGNLRKWGITLPTRSSVERLSYLKVASDFEKRIAPQPKYVCTERRSSSSRWCSDIEKDGRVSIPSFSFSRRLKLTEKHPSPSTSPVTYQGSIPLNLCGLNLCGRFSIEILLLYVSMTKDEWPAYYPPPHHTTLS